MIQELSHNDLSKINGGELSEISSSIMFGIGRFVAYRVALFGASAFMVYSSF